jgi:MinD-like ATPase involved in chromosome partitioning or flagellar assembly
MCDVLVVILRPDEQDYQGTAVTFEIAKRMEVPRTYLVANRVPPEFDAKSYNAELEKTFQHPVLGVIPFSYGLMMAQSKQVYCFASPNDPFSIAVKAMAGMICKAVQPK